MLFYIRYLYLKMFPLLRPHDGNITPIDLLSFFSPYIQSNAEERSNLHSFRYQEVTCQIICQHFALGVLICFYFTIVYNISGYKSICIYFHYFLYFLNIVLFLGELAHGKPVVSRTFIRAKNIHWNM